MSQKPHPAYEVQSPFVGVLLVDNSVVTYYPLQRGDVFIVESAVGDEHYSGAYVVSNRYGRIQLDSDDILHHCRRVG